MTFIVYTKTLRHFSKYLPNVPQKKASHTINGNNGKWNNGNGNGINDGCIFVLELLKD